MTSASLWSLSRGISPAAACFFVSGSLMPIPDSQGRILTVRLQNDGLRLLHGAVVLLILGFNPSADTGPGRQL